MDLLTYWRVVRRQSRIILLGLVLTFAAAAFALLHISSSGVEFRSPAQYVGKSTLLVTQPGFPWGRSSSADDPARVEYLAGLYAELAESSVVAKRVLGKNAPVGDDYEVTTLRSPDGRPLPLIEISGISSSSTRAVSLANRVATRLRAYVAAQQRQNKIRERSRIILPVVTRAEKASILRGLKMTSAVMIALLGVIGTLFAAFTIDNVRRQRALAAEALEDAPIEDEPRVHQLTAPVDEDAPIEDESRVHHLTAPVDEGAPIEDEPRVHQLTAPVESEVRSERRFGDPTQR